MKAGETSVSLQGEDLLTLTYERAVELFNTAKERKAAAAMPLKTFEADPNSGGLVQIKTGRFGPYVTDGKTNASLGKKYAPETMTFDEAVALLKKKREAPPSKWKGGKFAKKKSA
jgi:DNA topoisomerase-1